MSIVLGSARSDENYKASGGKAGDQRQKSSTNDTSGEVSMQSDYDHSKGWRLFRPVSAAVAEDMAAEMVMACNNKNVGYDQGQRQTLISYIKTNHCAHMSEVKTPVETDCAQLIRAIVYTVAGVDLDKYASGGNFYTGNACDAMLKSGLFVEVPYKSKTATTQYNGDVKCTKTKGHIVMVCKGNPRVKNTASAPAASTTAKATTTGGSFEMTMKTVQNGSKGAHVKALQILLKGLGYVGKDGKTLEIDSDCGANTVHAICSYQKNHGLLVDGIAGEKTFKCIMGVS